IEQEVHKVQILDPAAGTGTFLAEVIKQIYQRFKGQQGIWSSYVENHLLPRLNGFELLMASYAMAHLKIDLFLTETGFKATKNQRIRVFLTNSLEEHHPDTGTLFASWLSKEANEANHIKRDTPVMCVIGNPPYRGESANKGKWIMGLMENYKKEPGGEIKLKEKNSKWINDDYVKFLRYGQYFIEKNGSGILAFINPHGFLDNPTFRGMRWNLLKTYDKIYTIDLHGNSKKKEISPDGAPDQNVFDIMQGVSINVFVKTGKKKTNELGKVLHYDLYGKREFKYQYLIENNIKTIPFKNISNVAPNYYFVLKDFELQEKYNSFIILTSLFLLNGTGIVTKRDALAYQFSKQDIINVVTDIYNLTNEEIKSKYNNVNWESRDGKVEYCKNNVVKFGIKNKLFIQCNYRPFDLRWTYYTAKSKGFIGWPVDQVMKHFTKNNLGLVFKLGNAEENSVSSMVTKNVTDFRSWSRPGMQGGDYVSPLYLYPETNKQKTIEKSTERTPNLNQEIVDQIAKKLALTFTPEKEETENTFAPIDILDYIYAVLHSPNYREKYKEFLKIDFPRVPYPKNQPTFWQLVKLGGEIRQIHLLESPKVEQYITSYPKDGNNTITTKITKKDWELFDKTKQLGRIWINETQYFDNIPLIAWEFYIGGYQPAQKWLKDRKGITLEFEDILHYQKIIVALFETDRLMQEIDKIAVE
ncbi:MAG: DNA methyltransferase, partial [Thiomargarita sp.]|nr:DNA methyltransferase [Thiomargarita sp.]